MPVVEAARRLACWEIAVIVLAPSGFKVATRCVLTRNWWSMVVKNTSEAVRASLRIAPTMPRKP
ncbi:hypothetical protein D3C80_2019440 [compost metagenome]